MKQKKKQARLEVRRAAFEKMSTDWRARGGFHCPGSVKKA